MIKRLRVHGGIPFPPNYLLDTRPRTRALPRIGTEPAVQQSPLGWSIGSPQRSSCLPLQLFRIETLPLLPHGQNDGRDLARYGQTSELPERAGSRTGPRGCALEQSLQLMIVILIQPAERRRSLGALQLTASRAVFPADPGSQRQTTRGRSEKLDSSVFTGAISHQCGAD